MDGTLWSYVPFWYPERTPHRTHARRLDLYPNGNDENSGGNNISLYLVICDTQSFSKGWEVCVDVSFFVYDHESHNYATFQDIHGHGNRARFNERNKIWGFDQLISLESFKESKNGYLSNDACVFGVEVFTVSKFSQNDRCLSFRKPPAPTNTYTWRIDNFSKVTEECIYSEVFKIVNVKWFLNLYPKGENIGEDTHMATYLYVFDYASFPHGWRVYANFRLRVKNQSSKDDIETELDHWFSKSADNMGISEFMPLIDLHESANGFLVNDVFIMEVEISLLGTLKNFF
uniref:uncharacterized protein LOC122601429 n=1 Tax=Erigeron canadensis TaxID=72917 RepID=UPI001CB9B6F7|nr:uncharacterized protein LOC122601429 [Erigeron canadensis]